MSTSEPNLTKYEKQQKELPKGLRRRSGKSAAITSPCSSRLVQPELVGIDQLDRDQLADFAEQANGAHKACEQAARTMLSHARDCGDVLIRAKEYLRHGEWGGWLAENCQFSAGQARRYMDVARKWPEILKRARARDLNLEDLSMRAAIRLLTSGEEGEMPKEKAGPSVFVDMLCPSCGSQLVKTQELYVTCPECWACRLYRNPEYKGPPERTAPILLAFEQWQKMPAEDREYFLSQVDPNRSSEVSDRIDVALPRLVDKQAEMF